MSGVLSFPAVVRGPMPKDGSSIQELLEQARQAIAYAQIDGRADADFQGALELASDLVEQARLIYQYPDKVNREHVRKLMATAASVDGTTQRQNARKRAFIAEAFTRWAYSEITPGVPSRVSSAVEMAIGELRFELRFDGSLLGKLQEPEGQALSREVIEALRSERPADWGKAGKALLKHIGIGGSFKSVTRATNARRKMSRVHVT